MAFLQLRTHIFTYKKGTHNRGHDPKLHNCVKSVHNKETSLGKITPQLLPYYNDVGFTLCAQTENSKSVFILNQQISFYTIKGSPLFTN